MLIAGVGLMVVLVLVVLVLVVLVLVVLVLVLVVLVLVLVTSCERFENILYGAKLLLGGQTSGCGVR